MKDYVVDVTIHVEVRAENEEEAKDYAASVVAENMTNQVQTFFKVGKISCIGGDNELATEIAKEAGVPYETAEQFLDGIAPATQEKMSVQELVEKLEQEL